MTERRDARTSEPVVIRDRRRIDPETGEVRTPDGDRPAPRRPGAGQTAADRRRRRASPTPRWPSAPRTCSGSPRSTPTTGAGSTATARPCWSPRARQFVGELLTVLDDIDRAGAHGDLTGPFKAVADKIDLRGAEARPRVVRAGASRSTRRCTRPSSTTPPTRPGRPCRCCPPCSGAATASPTACCGPRWSTVVDRADDGSPPATDGRRLTMRRKEAG